MTLLRKFSINGHISLQIRVEFCMPRNKTAHQTAQQRRKPPQKRARGLNRFFSRHTRSSDLLMPRLVNVWALFLRDRRLFRLARLKFRHR